MTDKAEGALPATPRALLRELRDTVMVKHSGAFDAQIVAVDQALHAQAGLPLEDQVDLLRAEVSALKAQNDALCEHKRRFSDAFESLLAWVPGDLPSGAKDRAAGYRRGDEKAPFLTEAYLYNLLGKDLARSLLARVGQVIGTFGGRAAEGRFGAPRDCVGAVYEQCYLLREAVDLLANGDAGRMRGYLEKHGWGPLEGKPRLGKLARSVAYCALHRAREQER